MNTFLSRVVTDVLHKKEVANENLIFVLPSQRASVFLKQEIIKQLSTASFLPQIKSIENYIQELAEIKQLDTIKLLFEFYSIYQTHTNKGEVDSFDVFSQWAIVVLQDFNEVDRNLLNSKDLFTYLRDINRLKDWTPETSISKKYFSFFEKLHLYYNEFYNHLISKKQGYQGLIFREAESNILHYIQSNLEKHIVFVGFNALNVAEEKIVQELLENRIASIYWDADDSYLNTSKETGHFLRSYKKNWKYYQKTPFNWTDNYLDVNKNIHFINATKNTSQLKYVGSLLEQKGEHNNTALVLADESLLSLTLNSLPKNIEKINITMGFPLNEIPLTEFFNSIFKLYLHQVKFENTVKNKYYYKDILSLFNHPYLRKLTTLEGANSFSNIRKNNRIFLSEKQISKLFAEDEQHVLEKIKSLFYYDSFEVKNVIQNCITICENLKESVTGIEKEYVFRFYTIFQQLNTLNNDFGYIKNIKTLHQFFSQFVKNEKLSFQGEPLEGLQLMGMLETRAIDFETVIITSANEGILPMSKSEKSFIPFDVKKHFGLPTYQEKDAIFSYHFHRLLHRAKNIYLVYNTEGDAFGTGEKSRFLNQLELERNDINYKIVATKTRINNKELIKIEKSKTLINSLHELAKKGISPSALATYIYNPIDFYYQKILKIKDVDEVEETVAVNTMGTVIHETLEELYKPYINQILTQDCIKKMKGQSEQVVEKMFQKVYLNGEIDKGKNKLIFEVSKKYIDRFLYIEQEDIIQGKQIKIIALEKQLSAQVEIENLDFPLKLHGIIDRIDEVDGVKRIVDYKTGLVTSTQLKTPDFSLLSSDYKYTKALQVMLYTYLYSKETNFDFNNSIEAGIISFKNLNNGFLKMNFAEGRGKEYLITDDKMEEFIIELKQILVEIFNPEIPFLENKDKPF
jgi:hypothetical protein